MRILHFRIAVVLCLLVLSYCSKAGKKSSKPTTEQILSTIEQQTSQPTTEHESKSPMELLKESTCGKLIKSATNTTRGHLEKVLPNERFYNFIKRHSAPSDGIMLIDTDRHTWLMLVNQAVALKKAGSKFIVHAVAHDAEICPKVIAKGIPCYYDHQWYQELAQTYMVYMAGIGGPLKINMVMLVRMMTTMVALCEGRNVFLSDSDVLFYRDPMDYVFEDVNIMITSTPTDLERWSGFFFTDQPKQGQTLNNGVVFYRSNEVTKAFLLTLAAHCISGLIANQGDPDGGFLQTAFNMDLNSANLRVHPSSDVSSNTTYKLTSAAGYNNLAGECFDCYHGTVPWQSDIVATSNKSVLRVGIFPTTRCISSSFISTQKAQEIVTASAQALRKHDKNRWGWGELDGESRMMCVHANGHSKAIEGEDGMEMSGKEIWFRKLKSWFLRA